MPLSRGEVNNALRMFTIAGGMWGAWGQMLGIGSVVFTGFVLTIGGEASDIAFFTSIAYIVAPVQMLSSLGSRWILNKRRWVIVNGILESLFRGIVIGIPFLFVPVLHLTVLSFCLAMGLIAGYLYNPFYNNWLADTVPTSIRARFTSRQTIVSQVCGVIAGIASGWFVDYFPETDRMTAFVSIFIVGTLFGWGGHAAISRAQYPPQSEDDPEDDNMLQKLILPFRDLQFRRLLLYYASWNLAVGVAGPLFSVFMLDRLGFSFTAISVLNGLGVASTIVGYRVWSSLIDRFGGKPVAQILLIPAALNAILWGSCQPGNFVMVTIAMLIAGFIMSGINVSITPMLYGLLPESNLNLRLSYLASWSTCINLISAMGPIMGGIMVATLAGFKFNFGELTFGDINVMFFISALLRFIPSILLRRVSGSGATSSKRLLSQIFQGNVFNYAFHNIMLNVATGEERRAKSTFALGRSRNPLAVDHLMQAISDASPAVRRQAARALGETGSDQASETLISVLRDGTSDIREEAARALGRLKHPKAVDPLFEALEDSDPRIQISAIQGLAEFGGPDVEEMLFWYFSNRFDVRTFPILVESLSKFEDQRVIKPVFDRMGAFPSKAIRLQLLNSVCRIIGANSRFYQFLNLEEHKRYGELEDELEEAIDVLAETYTLPEDTRRSIIIMYRNFKESHEQGDIEGMMFQGRLLSALIRDTFHPEAQNTFDTLSVYLTLMTIDQFVNSSAHQDLPAVQEIFLVVCFARVADILREC